MNSDQSIQSRVLLVDFGAGSHGHRGPLNSMLARLFRLEPATFSLATILDARPVLVPIIEQAPLRFFFTCLIRGLLGRRTVGLLFRPGPTLQAATARLWFKRLGCRLLLGYPGARVLTIVPFAAEPGFASIAHGWIHDPQEWDLQLGPAGSDAPTRLTSERIRAEAAGRQVCIALGTQSHEKGFDRLARSYLERGDLRAGLHLAVGGCVTPDQQANAKALVLHGATCLDRYISDAELLGFYDAADLVWCCYAPEYDQASGILGRAMQYGLPVIVRHGSLVAGLCRLAGYPYLALQDGEALTASSLPLPRLSLSDARALACEKGRSSLAGLAVALGAEPAWDPFSGSTLAESGPLAKQDQPGFATTTG